jgi:hypothetical protein
MPLSAFSETVITNLGSAVRHCYISVIAVADFPFAALSAALVAGKHSRTAAIYAVNSSASAAKCA